MGRIVKYETETIPEYVTESLFGFRTLGLGRFRTVWVLARLDGEINTYKVEILSEERLTHRKFQGKLEILKDLDTHIP